MKTFLALLFLFLPLPVLAQNTVISPMPCDKPEKVFKLIADNRESLLFTSEGAMMLAPTYRYYKGVIMVFVNPETRKYTIAIQWPEGIVCMIAAGVNFEPYGGPQPWESLKSEEEL